jgi:molybdopterin converting factor small subunit
VTEAPVPVLVRVPSAFRGHTGSCAVVSAQGRTVREVLEDLDRTCPGLRARVLDDAGAVRRYVNLFLNDEDVRSLRALETPVRDGDCVVLVTAVAGG